MAYSLIEKLYGNKPYTETKEILDRKVEFRVLSASEADEIMRSINAVNVIDILQSSRIPILAKAVQSIDGIKLSDFEEVKQLLNSNKELNVHQAIELELRKPEYSDEVISSLYSGYLEVKENHRKTLGDFQKKLNPQSPVTAG